MCLVTESQQMHCSAEFLVAPALPGLLTLDHENDCASSVHTVQLLKEHSSFSTS